MGRLPRPYWNDADRFLEKGSLTMVFGKPGVGKAYKIAHAGPKSSYTMQIGGVT